MALPVAPFLFKFVVLKVFKGALVGIVRFVKRLANKEHKNAFGESLSGNAKIKHILTKEWHRKDNVLYLILMLGNAFYGLQELCLWIWYIIARKTWNEYCACVPASLELPETFVDRVHHLPWPTLLRESLGWLGMASLIYWPQHHPSLQLHHSDSPDWIE
ncbi:MAG: hypothetical protein R3240_08335, partial [Gammaproteobacteria bacterium]|nr:hypothetical protein [Gammaproteobacteria bacterium]